MKDGDPVAHPHRIASLPRSVAGRYALLWLALFLFGRCDIRSETARTGSAPPLGPGDSLQTEFAGFLDRAIEGIRRPTARTEAQKDTIESEVRRFVLGALSGFLVPDLVEQGSIDLAQLHDEALDTMRRSSAPYVRSQIVTRVSALMLRNVLLPDPDTPAELAADYVRHMLDARSVNFALLLETLKTLEARGSPDVDRLACEGLASYEAYRRALAALPQRWGSEFELRGVEKILEVDMRPNFRQVAATRAPRKACP